MTQKLILIGGGNMGGAIAARLHQAGQYAVHVVEREAARRAMFDGAGMTTHATLAEAPRGDTYILAIKPQQFPAVAGELTIALKDHSPLLLSIMAGITLFDLQAVTPHVVRVMPNLPALIGESMSVLCAPGLDADAREIAEQIFTAIGAVAWVADEDQLHAVTAVSGSGPAYVFALMEALEQAAAAHGLSPELARKLVSQTLRGAALLADQSADDVATLRRNVTSPGGTTEAALECFTKGDLHGLVNRTVEAAAERSKELAKN